MIPNRPSIRPSRVLRAVGTLGLATLIATLDRNLLHGTMPDSLKSTIAGALTASGGSAQERAMLALYLVAASPAFNIQK